VPQRNSRLLECNGMIKAQKAESFMPVFIHCLVSQ